MTFEADVGQALGADAFRKGLRAMKAADSGHVSTMRPRQLLGSADVDQSLAQALPNAARWDYVVGRSHGGHDQAHWIEIHPAGSDANIGEVKKKLAWLTAWLRGNPLAAYPRDVVWVASGKSAFNVRAPAVRALAAQGCRFVGGHLRL
jgi:hypothetical protein